MVYTELIVGETLVVPLTVSEESPKSIIGELMLPPVMEQDDEGGNIAAIITER